MTNRVDIEVTGTNKFDATQAAVMRDLRALEAQGVKTSLAMKKLNASLDEKPKFDGVREAEKALRKLSGTADEEFGKVKSKMEKAFEDANVKAKIKVKAELDKENLKSSFADGLSKLDFFGDKDIVKGGFGGKILQGMLKGIDFAEAGAKGAASFIGGLGDGLKAQHPAVQAAVYGSLAIAVLTVAPFIGAALAGGIVAGFGAGIGALGIVAAAQNDKVKATYKDLWDGIVADIKSRSSSIESVLLNTAERAQTIFTRIAPELQNAMAGVAPGLERLLDGVLRSIERFVPALKPIAEAADAVFSDLGSRLPDIIGGMADSFAELADAVKKNPQALGDLVSLMGKMVQIGVGVLEFLTDWRNNLAELAKGLNMPALSNFLIAIGVISGKTGEAKTNMTGLSDATGTTTDKLSGIQKTFQDLADAEDDAAKRGDVFLDVLNKMSGITPSFDDALKNTNDTIRELIENFTKTGAASDGFGKDLLTADGHINTMTANGSKLYDAISTLRESFADMAGATKELEEAGLSHEEAVRKVNDAFAVQSQRLIDAAGKMGLNQDQMRELLRLYGLTPKQIDTLLQLDDKNFRDRMAYNLLPGTKLINVVYNQVGKTLTEGTGRVYGVTDYAQGGNVAKAASGGVRRGDVVINDGPGYPGEAVRLPNGSTVWPAGMTQMMMKRAAQGAMIGAGRAGGTTTLEWVGPPDLIEYLKANVRVRGGDPSVFG